MRIDFYTKVVLTVIAGFLGLIALRPFVGPEVVQAQGVFSGVQFASATCSLCFFDSRTGEFWNPKSGEHSKLTKLGQDLVPMK
jgi:hypothetical protein